MRPVDAVYSLNKYIILGLSSRSPECFIPTEAMVLGSLLTFQSVLICVDLS